MKKKQLVTLILLLVIVAGLGVGYVIFQNYDDEKKREEEEKETEEKEAIQLFGVNSDDIESILYTHEGQSVTIINEEGSFKQKDTEVPMSEDRMDEMFEALSSVTAVKVITESADDLKEFGLDSPAVSYTVNMKDGSSHSVKLGIQVPTKEENYYAMVDDDKKIYSMTSDYYRPFTRTLIEMTDIIDAPDIQSDYITEVAVKTKEGMDFAAAYLGEENSKGYYSWEITKPYKDVLADTDRWKEKLSLYSSIEFENCVAFNTEEYEKYGLDDPVATVKIRYYSVGSDDTDGTGDTGTDAVDSGTGTTDGENAVTTPVPESEREYHDYVLDISAPVTINDDDTTKEICYVRPDGTANIYSMAAEDAEKLYGYTPYDVADGCVYAKLIEDIKSFDVQFGDTDLTIERKDEKPENTPEPGAIKKKKDTINVYYVNGKKVDEQKALDLYAFAYLLEFSGEADQDKVSNSDKPVLTITYHLNDGGETVVKFLPYDGDNFYHVDRNGMRYFLTDKRGIDTLITKYEEFLKEL